MVVLGLLLLAAAVVVGIELILANHGATSQVNIHLWGWHWNNVDAFWMAVAGAIIIVAALLGLALLKLGSARQWRLSRERRNLAKENRRLAAGTGRDTTRQDVRAAEARHEEREETVPPRQETAPVERPVERPVEPPRQAPVERPVDAPQQTGTAPGAAQPYNAPGGYAGPGGGTYPPQPPAEPRR